MQFRPRLTGESGSPWVATMRPFCTPTSTEQPVPQKRQAALSQRTLVLAPPSCAWVTTGMPMPAVAAAAAIALFLMNSRRFMLISDLRQFQTSIGVFISDRQTLHLGGEIHRQDRVGHRPARTVLDGDDDAALFCRRPVQLDAGNLLQGFDHVREVSGERPHDQPCNVHVSLSVGMVLSDCIVIARAGQGPMQAPQPVQPPVSRTGWATPPS